MITATVYPRRNYLGLRKPSWGINFTRGNNKKIGHQYNSIENAVQTVEEFFSDPAEEVVLRVVDEKGFVYDRRRIRG